MNEYAQQCIRYFKSIGVQYQLDESDAPDVAPPASDILKPLIGSGLIMMWASIEHAWYNGVTNLWLTNPTAPAAQASSAEVAPVGYWFPLEGRYDCIALDGMIPSIPPAEAVPGFMWVWDWENVRWYQTIKANGMPTGKIYPASTVPAQATAPTPKPNKVLDWFKSLPQMIWDWLGEKYGGWRYLIMIGLVAIILLCGWVLLKVNLPAPIEGATENSLALPAETSPDANPPVDPTTVCGAGAISLDYVDETKSTLAFEAGFLPTLGGTYYVANPPDLVTLLTGGGADTLESLQNFNVAGADKWDTNSGPYLWRAAGLGWGSSIVNGFVQAKDWDNAVKDIPRSLYSTLVTYIAAPTQCLTFPTLDQITRIPQAEEDRMKAEGAPKPAPDPFPTQPPKDEGSATPVPDVAISNRPAYEKHVAIVGEAAAKVAFTANPGSQCYATITASWTDFTTNTPMTEVLRILGPNGYKPSALTDFDFNTLVSTQVKIFRSVDVDQGGLTACIIIDQIVTTYPQGTWNLEVGILRWSKVTTDPQEVLTGENQISLWPVYNPTLPTPMPTPIPPSGPKIVQIYDLPQWMVDHGVMSLSAPCPYEPLGGVINLNSEVSVTFVGDLGMTDTNSALRYSRAVCERVGQLTFTTYDPGRPEETLTYYRDSFNGPFLWVYPMAKPIVTVATATPGGPTLPPSGSTVSLSDLLTYMVALNKTYGGVACDQGSLPGWPNSVVVNLTTFTYITDFGPIAGMINTDRLCGWDPVSSSTGVGVNFQNFAPSGSDSAMCSWIQWNDWYFCPGQGQ